MKVCAVCGSRVRKGRRNRWYHKVPGHPELETICREVTNEQYAKPAGVRPRRAKTAKSQLVTQIEGF